MTSPPERGRVPSTAALPTRPPDSETASGGLFLAEAHPRIVPDNLKHPGLRRVAHVNPWGATVYRCAPYRQGADAVPRTVTAARGRGRYGNDRGTTAWFKSANPEPIGAHRT